MNPQPKQNKPPKQVLSDKDKEYLEKNWRWINEKFNKKKEPK